MISRSRHRKTTRAALFVAHVKEIGWTIAETVVHKTRRLPESRPVVIADDTSAYIMLWALAAAGMFCIGIALELMWSFH